VTDENLDLTVDSAPSNLSPTELAAALRVLRKLLPLGPTAMSAGNVGPLEAALRIYGARRERRHFLPVDLFSDPAWDMLIMLYCAEGQGQPVTVTALCNAADIPPTTGLRWVNELERRGLIVRRPHPSDRRSTLAALSEEARERLRAFFSRVGEQCFPI